MYVHIIS